MIIRESKSTTENKFLASEPERLRVIIFNDEITTQDFVVMLLMRLFGHDLDQAITLMLEVHISGAGVAGTYAFDVALFKRNQALKMAREANYPLKIECEKVE